MKSGNYSKTGGKAGKPGYRTASTFRNRKYFAIKGVKTRHLKDQNKYSSQP